MIGEKIVGSVERVRRVPDALVSGCYAIADQTRPAQAADVLASLRDDVERRGHVLFVFNTAYGVRGFIKGTIAARGVGCVDWLFVDKAWHRNGIGGRLMAAYAAVCRENNVCQIVLYSAPNLRALKFYEKVGFERAGANYKMCRDLTR